MRRERTAPRPDWRTRVEARGLDWHTSETGQPYWDESAFWRFDADEIDRIEAASETLWRLCLHAIGHVVDGGELAGFGYGPQACELITRSWRARDDEPSLYARFDLAYDGRDLKLLELNADTPTSLVEAAVVQWWWLQDRFPDLDQFNSIHEKLVSAFGRIAARARAGALPGVLHLTCGVPHAEDEGTIAYLAVCAAEAGLRTPFVALDRIGWREGPGTPGHFVDEADLPIRQLFKLVPWEWLLSDPFGEPLAGEVLAGRIRLIEPAWKMLASHKRLLVTLSELNPGHDLLLEATESLGAARRFGEFVRKPVHGREGQNVTLLRATEFATEEVERTRGFYGGDDFVYQRRARLAEADGVTAVLGAWIVDGQACGLGVREADGPITGDTARFVPHVIG
jgi:glutathionylspermidine synthase